MGHAERIIAEIASLDDAEQARLLAFVEALKASRAKAGDSAVRDAQAALAAALAPFRVRMDGYRFDREEANAR